ncbi:nucleoside triphosphate pyrophosphohydrolase [Xiashengella succiniciproducens]|jgi:MazG family protein|uniref:Nucleoside triphosphate pyrophosphohydrolase n=1 Tax=Xiashengella succiniciproducens TaxID=2949635 RepID=A0A9J6ZL58_9BACT|nr:nucleoside triphosphate pyrophosphohydrolase [Alkaliflexus sp. Ai-910]MDI9538596.1 nucleoside triphosphate pyrophosphohydrolase [Bacteroidota bacterium]URW78594.1 nucleoside triphosphate pyrophosphohydrolase [Alkaliflexus sp. Ai-910]HHU01208.1 nucleoside triphosphate pyrophosphohydrolase [Bacteroidales bacterium]
MQDKKDKFQELLEVMNLLREKCPWDKVQTNESLRTLTIEETYELSEAILKNDDKLISKELGDLLLHIVFYSRIGEEKGSFDIGTVMQQLIDKLIYRHPHIFAEVEVANKREVEENWEKLKLKEKDGNKSVLSGVPSSLPAMIKAYRMQDKARGVGFDWDEKNQVWDKVAEELEELKQEIATGDMDKIEDEFGDVFFSLINAARLYNINPEDALERTNRKFLDRFSLMEQETIKKGLDLKKMNLDELNFYWDKAKEELKKEGK